MLLSIRGIYKFWLIDPRGVSTYIVGYLVHDHLCVDVRDFESFYCISGFKSIVLSQ